MATDDNRRSNDAEPESTEDRDSGGLGSTGLPPGAEEQFHEYFRFRQEAAAGLRDLLRSGDVSGRLDSIAYRCFTRAIDLAVVLGNAEVGAIHLITALASDSDSQQILRKAGLNPNAILNKCTRRLRHREPQWEKGGRVPPPLSRDLLAWVLAARTLADQEPSPEYRSIDVNDLIAVAPKMSSDELQPSAAALLQARPGRTLHELINIRAGALERRVGHTFSKLDTELMVARDDRESKHDQAVQYFQTIHGAADKARETVEQHRMETREGFKSISVSVGTVGSLVQAHRGETANEFKETREQSRQEFASLFSLLKRIDETSSRIDFVVQRLDRARLPIALVACGLLVAVLLGGATGIYLRP